jgi:Domain of unknown function (DUF4328)
MQELRPNGERAKKAILWIKLLTATRILLLLVHVLNLYFNPNVFKFLIRPDFFLYLNPIVKETLEVIYLFFNIISISYFIMWFRRAYYNLHFLVSNLAYKENWAAAAWFIPGLNFYRPFEIMKEIFSATCFLFKGKVNEIQVNKMLNTSLVNLWFLFFLLDTFIIEFFWTLASFLDRMHYFPVNNTVLIFIYIFFKLIFVSFSTYFTIKVVKNYSYVETYFVNLKNDIQMRIDSIGQKNN